jgi:Zn-dependent protease with chaperone function
MRISQIPIGPTFGSRFGQDLGFGNLVSIILSNAIVIAGILMFVLILAGGFGIIMSAGSNNPEGAEKGKKAITAAVIGFIIIFASYWIIKIIEKITGLTILESTL